MEKITYVSVLTKILNNEPLTDEEREKVAKLKEREEKRSHSDPSKPTKKQAENAENADLLLTIMQASGESLTISDWIANNPQLEGYSYQKVGAFMRILENSGKVIKTTEKRKSYFKVLEEA